METLSYDELLAKYENLQREYDILRQKFEETRDFYIGMLGNDTPAVSKPQSDSEMSYMQKQDKLNEEIADIVLDLLKRVKALEENAKAGAI